MSQITPSLTNLPPEVLALLGSTPAIPPPEGVGCVAYYVACVWGAQRGRIGIHEWDISILQASSLDLLIPAFLITVLTPLTFLFLKTSFFILYLQVFSQLQWLRICAWFGLATTALTYTVLTIIVFVFSTPRHGESWLTHQTSEAEKHITQLSVPQSAIGLILDLYILVLPMAGVSSLRMSPRRKFGVMSMFFSGVMACICSICSIYYRHILTASADTTWHLIPVNISTLSEMLVGVICACMPAAAYTARHEDSIYRRILRVMTVPFESFRSTLRESKSSSISSRIRTRQTHKGDEENALKSTDRKYARYFNLDILTSGSTGIQNTGTSMTTITGSSQAKVTEAKGIQRQIDIDIENSQMRRSVNG
ncbi:hypothetical protein EYC84_008929 [Monilinia fructicola]|uniref:Rhodopsin domain-containing protein n=1 Tax=Monilinia fructicola TaxID=38448 RepID=A0A5M9JF69_MONFR|nr:hypothetical protein EYC84_008929 [Monilinia fructicola]